MLKAINLYKYFGEDVVLRGASFSLEKGNKVALTGFNGAGKTTLLKILAGVESYSNGVLQTHPDVRIGFVPQDPKGFNELTVRAYLEQTLGTLDQAMLRRVSVMCAGFLLPESVMDTRIGELSSGQKTKVFLTGVLLMKPDLILLDEPTNNLDIPALIWLEDYLVNVDAACVIVSHDRAFLDAVANKVFEIDWHDHTLHISSAKYSDYVRERALQHARDNRDHVLQQEEVGRLRDVVQYKRDRGHAGAKWKSPDNDRLLQGFKQNRAGKSLTEAKVTARRIKRMELIKKPQERKPLSLGLDAETDAGPRNMICKDIVAGYGDAFSIGPVSLEVPYGTRMCFVGPNGVGKTTLLKTITGALPPLAGACIVDSGVRFGNFMQEHESLPDDESLLTFLRNHTGAPKEDVYNHLRGFGFSESAIEAPIGVLSPGGRARLLFAYFAALRVNVLILDEPTNHLDIEAEAALEASLAAFTGTVITVSHDRRFVEQVHFDALYVVAENGLEKVADFGAYVTRMEARARKLLHMLRA